MLKKPLEDTEDKAVWLLILGVMQISELKRPNHTVVNECVDTAKANNISPKLVNAILRQYIRSKPKITNSQTETSMPQWLLDKLNKEQKDKVGEICHGSNIKPKLYARLKKKEKNKLLKAMDASGLHYKKHPILEDCIEITSKAPITKIPGFNNGGFYIQDPGAQLAAIILEPTNQDNILDACAAPGGKTCHILDISPKCKLTAVDSSAKRAKKYEKTLKGLSQRHLYR